MIFPNPQSVIRYLGPETENVVACSVALLLAGPLHRSRNGPRNDRRLSRAPGRGQWPSVLASMKIKRSGR